MLITATELKENIAKYLALADREDIIITKNGQQIARLTSINKRGASLTDTLIGVIPDQAVDLAGIRKERLERHESTD